MGEQDVDRVAQRYHLDRGHQSFQTQQQALEQADRRVDDGTRGSWLLGPFAPVLRRLHEDAATVLYDHKLPGEVAGLKQGLEMRAAPGFESHDYEAFSHPQLHQMVTQGVDPGAVGEMGDTWLKIGNALTSFQDDIARTLARSETSWQGTSGDRARQAVASLGNRGAQAGQAAQLAGVVMHQQSAALATAKNSMPPPPSHPFDAHVAEQRLQTVTDPIAFASQAAADQQAFNQQKAAHQEAARVVKEYDTTVAQTSRNMPAFAPSPSRHSASRAGTGGMAASGSAQHVGGNGSVAGPTARCTAHRG